MSGIKEYLIFFSVSQLGILIGFSLVGLFIYTPYRKHLKDTLYDSDLDEVYEDKYMLYEYSDLDDKDRDKSTLKNTYVIENTPDGNVTMTYDDEEEGFVFWADKSIMYKYLQVVARKYVIQNHCVSLYKGYTEVETEEENEVETEAEAEAETEAETKTEDSVFIVKKKYNNNDKNQRTRTNISNIEKNKYIHRGNMKDLLILKDEVNINKGNGLSFSEFKKMNKAEQGY